MPDKKNKPNVQAYMPKDDIDIEMDTGIMYFTIYARVQTGEKIRYIQYQSGAYLNADMSIIKDTIRILLKSLYAPADSITLMTAEQFQAVQKQNPDAQISKIVNTSKIVEAI